MSIICKVLLLILRHTNAVILCMTKKPPIWTNCEYLRWSLKFYILNLSVFWFVCLYVCLFCIMMSLHYYELHMSCIPLHMMSSSLITRKKLIACKYHAGMWFSVSLSLFISLPLFITTKSKSLHPNPLLFILGFCWQWTPAPLIFPLCHPVF